MLRLGITGGIGMGKSTAAELLLRLGVEVVDTDVLARELVAPGQPALVEIREAFGSRILQADGALDRAALADLVFRDPCARIRLEGLLHPRIRNAWQERLREWATSGRPTAAVVIPLLFETAAESHFDVVVCLACSPQTQRRRLRARGWSDPQIDGRIGAQLPIERKMEQCQHVIWTEPPPDVHADQWRLILARHRRTAG